jgi:hypothetical protein
MISERERRILAEIEQHLRREDPRMAQRLETTTAAPVGRRWISCVTSIWASITWLLLLLVSVLLGLAVAAVLFFVLALCGAVSQARQPGDLHRS